MTPDELKAETEQHNGPAAGLPPRPRRHRSGRGRRGRGRRPLAQAPSAQGQPAGTLAESTHEALESVGHLEQAPPREQHREPKRVAPGGVQAAIEEVNTIIENLREVLDEMDGVLETLELAERQKNADEHEIDSLRRALRQVHRPREKSAHHPQEHSQESSGA